jgi:hypothetical protein
VNGAIVGRVLERLVNLTDESFIGTEGLGLQPAWVCALQEESHRAICKRYGRYYEFRDIAVRAVSFAYRHLALCFFDKL